MAKPNRIVPAAILDEYAANIRKANGPAKLAEAETLAFSRLSYMFGRVYTSVNEWPIKAILAVTKDDIESGKGAANAQNNND